MVWLFGGTCRSAARLDGKVAVVTGSNTGIGKETAQDLAARGALVVMAVRDTAKGEIAAADIRRQLAKQGEGKGPAGDVRVEALDLASLRSVRECARRILEEVKDVHILVNNAGIMACPKAYTEDGHDMQFGVNHLGHFLLTVLLLPRMRASTADSDQPARIVNVSSVAYSFYKIDFDDLRIEKNYKPLLAYARSKLANMLFTRELARRFKDSGLEHVNSYCLHPGVVATELFRTFDYFIFPGIPFLIHHIGRYFIKTPKQGAQTSIYCAVHEKTAKESGLYYVDCSSTTPFAIARDDEAALRLWDVSLELVGLKGYDPVTAAEAPAWAFQEPGPAAEPRTAPASAAEAAP